MLEDILSPQKGLFADGAHTELRGQVNRTRRVALLAGNLVQNARSEVSGVSARVYKNGVYGFSSMAEYTPEAARAVLAAASENAAFMDSRVRKNRPPLPPAPAGTLPPPRALYDAPQGIYIDFARAVDARVTARCPHIVSRRIVAYEDSTEKLLRVSQGQDAHTISPRSYCYIFLTAETPAGVPVELFDVAGGAGVFSENFSDPAALDGLIDRLCEKLMAKREGVYADAGEKTVVLGGMMTGMLSHEAVGHTVEADLVLGGSVAGHCLGQPVASEKVTMTDFASTAFGAPVPLPVLVDDEGTPARDAVLIRDGVLTGYMNSRETAPRFGMEALGNARGWSFSDEPLIRMRNTAIHPGTDRLEDMIASVDDGYYLISSGNGQADTTGEFMFGVTMGYEIKKGRLGRALLDTTVSGVAFDMLKTVDMVSDQVIWASSGFCGKKQIMPVGMGGPALRCRITIGGR